MKNIYMDNAATTQIKEEVLVEIKDKLDNVYGNPSSIYKIGRDSKTIVETSREKVAKAIGAKTKEIYFTASGSEADNWAIKGIAYANNDRGNHIITTKIEHHAVLDTCKYLERKGFEVTYLDVDEYGVVNLEQLRNSIKETTILISIMYANNEIGTLQPIEEIGEIARENKIYFHTDAVQALGSIDINLEELKVDLLSISAHKIYGPKGIGALYIRQGVKIDPLVQGGGQERNRRAGTENVPYIAGFGKAIEMATANISEKASRLSELRDYFIRTVQDKIDYTRLNGHPTKRLPGNVNISFQYIEGESLLLSLDMVGVGASSGSACTSGSLDPSHVLLAIGLNHETAHGSLRLSLGDFNTREEIDYTVEKLIEIVARLRSMSPLYEKIKEEN